MSDLSEIGDSELIAELYSRNFQEKETFTVDELLANFNFKVDVIFDRCLKDLDDLQKEIRHNQIRSLYIKGEPYDHLLPEGHFIFFSEWERNLRMLA